MKKVSLKDGGTYHCRYGAGLSKMFETTRLIVEIISTPTNFVSKATAVNDETSPIISSVGKDKLEQPSSTQIEKPVTVPTRYKDSEQIGTEKNTDIKESRDQKNQTWSGRQDKQQPNQAQQKWLIIFSVLLTVFLSIVIAIFVLLFIEMYREKNSKDTNLF